MPPLQMRNNTAKKKCNSILLIKSLHERSLNGSMPWHRFEEEIEKEPATPPIISESQDNIVGRGFLKWRRLAAARGSSYTGFGWDWSAGSTDQF